ncbi:MAG: type II toxin-antitoxin system HipA family toxin [Propionibacteriaceae bacterium]|jgi:serine/threonine-protein kinase HipA|nr:type II toxin-antitoxin system HipA family toxin [Propionibacteriaceae bacterium]
MTTLHVVMNGTIIGDIEGSGSRLRLRYDPTALRREDFVPLSVNLPPTQARWRGKPIITWLSGLLPDRAGVIHRWRAQFGIRDLHVESVLEHVGEDVAGAAQFVRPDRLETVLERKGFVEVLSDRELGDIVRAARHDMLPYDDTAAEGRFSLAGAQAKFALQRTPDGWGLPSGAEPSTHIFKPAIPGLVDQDVTEMVTMRSAALLGLPTAKTSISTFDGERVIGIERYDRFLVDGRWTRIHQEDLCQAAGVDPKLKYESQGGPGVAMCAAIIRRSCGDEDVRRFARSLVFNHLVRGSDAHARNYSILLTPGEARLAPLYDLNSTLSFGERWATHAAMRIGGEDRFDHITPTHWRQAARDMDVDPEWLCAEFRAMAERLPDVIMTVSHDDEIRDIAPMTATTLVERTSGWCAQVLRGWGPS